MAPKKVRPDTEIEKEGGRKGGATVASKKPRDGTKVGGKFEPKESFPCLLQKF
jgi:hypothetical protein